jgi:hypothetical protein
MTSTGSASGSASPNTDAHSLPAPPLQPSQPLSDRKSDRPADDIHNVVFANLPPKQHQSIIDLILSNKVTPNEQIPNVGGSGFTYGAFALQMESVRPRPVILHSSAKSALAKTPSHNRRR